MSSAETDAAAAPPGAVLLALQRAAHATLRMLVTRLSGLELTGSEINALACLADGRERAVGELAVLTGTRPTTLTSLLDRLAGRGLVARQLDPGDRRSFRVSLTPAGQPMARAALAAMGAVEQAALAGLTPAELAGYHAVVQALTRAPHQEVPL